MLYEAALDAGVDPIAYWGYTPLQLMDLIEREKRVRAREVKQRVTEAFVLAEVSARYRAISNENPELPHPWEYFPELFAEEKKVYEEALIEKQVEEAGRNRRQIAALYNERFTTKGQGE